LLLSNNDGGPERPTLRWADSDAANLGAVLVSLGGLTPNDRLLVPNADRKTALATLATADLLARTARASGARVELIVYYSGHADASGLRMGRDTLPFAELRERILAIDTALTLTIIDACASGGILRPKGGTPTAGFLAPSTSASIKGQVFLTSAAADELAQESDRLQASFFTHDLIAALRGAADFDDDRQVTLTEAYRYAHATTQARSREAAETPQNPSWDLALSGSGDLVLTRLDVTQGSGAANSLATLTLDPTLSGRLSLFDDRGRLALELDKPAGEHRTLTIPAGAWRLQMTRARRRYEATFTIAAGGTHLSSFKHLDFRETIEETRLRGGPPTTRLRVSAIPTIGFDGPGSTAVVHGVSLALLGDAIAELRGAQLAPLFNVATYMTGAQLGLVNVATDVTGVQLGLVNIASRVTGAQLGLFSWVDDGLHHLEVYTSTEHAVHIGYRIGNDYLHTALALGFAAHGETDMSACSLFFGVGTRVDFAPITLDFDLGPTFDAPKCQPSNLGQTASLGLRALIGYELTHGVGLFAGARVALTFDDTVVEPGALFGLRLFR
jgi:hypothetical protein